MKQPFINISSCLFCILLLFAACESVTEWELLPGENQQLVVEAIITDEFGPKDIRLSLSVDGLNEAPVPVTDAEVSISGLLGNYELLPDLDDLGRYVSPAPFAAIPTLDYLLAINWQGQEYKATATMGPVSPITPITFAPVAETDSFTIGTVAPIYHPVQQALYEIDIDWNHIIPSDSSKARMYYYTFNTLNVSQLVPPPKAQVLFPRGSIVVEKKYGLSPGFAAYLRALVIETEWKGGVFDEAPSSLPTNIEGGGLGWFGVCALKRDTVVVQ